MRRGEWTNLTQERLSNLIIIIHPHAWNVSNESFIRFASGLYSPKPVQRKWNLPLQIASSSSRNCLMERIILIINTPPFPAFSVFNEHFIVVDSVRVLHFSTFVGTVSDSPFVFLTLLILPC
jgi:hypothetical protein